MALSTKYSLQSYEKGVERQLAIRYQQKEMMYCSYGCTFQLMVNRILDLLMCQNVNDNNNNKCNEIIERPLFSICSSMRYRNDPDPP